MITIDPPGSSPSLALLLKKPILTRFLARARAAVLLAGEVEVLLAGDAELKRLNRSYRGKNKPTDVLSFPAPEEIAALHAGDLAISLETAARQAEAYGHTLEIEVKVLLLHGLLHLAGMDHETDDGEMAARERELRAKLRLPVSLIDRVMEPKAKPARKAIVRKAAVKKAAKKASA